MTAMDAPYTITEKRPRWLEVRAGDDVIAVCEMDPRNGRWGIRLIDPAVVDILDSTVEVWCDNRSHLDRLIYFHARLCSRSTSAAGV